MPDQGLALGGEHVPVAGVLDEAGLPELAEAVGQDAPRTRGYRMEFAADGSFTAKAGIWAYRSAHSALHVTGRRHADALARRGADIVRTGGSGPGGPDLRVSEGDVIVVSR
jgi:uncharacterized protein YjlB